ncbi:MULTISPECIES: hypothetical protein [Acidithiobacillus]|uniref:Uncharacterized protein n=1 Tax=Acidithiobacillus thiooxidans ATCC 19377 TaxID=637390 RepID=A0A5P9XSS6_ACITH|nr:MULTISPECIES: hypothetical protein [Acidithiobacillus]MBE7567289.1 hypothetical protein [Acidithiobacillus sp. HP-11]MBU2743611.1 hypothetical protein [Acidithiobacillus albertensis]MBU2750713.1 hypothetical protein [Acidithiobacillus thiooxidans]MBU2837609.1 hypothetical protein [Acidithiobacillus thiooxidans]MDA8176619.1 hypothetical protein [Acidithiobacillus sp.]
MQFSGVRDFDLVQSSSALRDSLLQNWAAGGDVTHCYLAVFTFFGNTAPDGPGFAIAVRTGQPKSFYMPPQVEKNPENSIPDSGQWYAVFNMPGNMI